MAFRDSSRNIRLEGNTLHAQCCGFDGKWNSSRLHLNEIIGNSNGEFHWWGAQFNDSAEEVRLEGTILRARLRDVSGKLREAQVDLNERITNYGGSLAYKDRWNGRIEWRGQPDAGGRCNLIIGGIVIDEKERQRKETQDALKIEAQRVEADYLLSYRDAFEYSPLPTPTSIRLLKIEGSRGIRDMIHCSLTTVDLADEPQYDALSYTWGNPFLNARPELESHYGRSAAICCNGQRVLVKQNLYDALRRLRQPDIIEERDTPHNKTALIRAAEEGNFSRLYDLLSRGAEVQSRDAFGATALHYAAGRNDVESVKALVVAGSDVHALDINGRRPIDRTRGRSAGVMQLLTRSDQQDASHSRRTTCLRNKVVNTEYVWIDAICINQTDDAEKAVQVGLMGQIYKRAQSVVVWLGKERQDPKDSLTSDLLQHVWLLELATRHGKLDDDTLDVLLHDPDGYRSASISSALSSAASDWLSTFKQEKLEDWLEGVPLYTRRWFERAWIIQEVLMADEVTVVCGQFVLPWHIFVIMSCVIDAIRNILRKGHLPWTSSFNFNLAVTRGETLLTRINQEDEIPAMTLERKRRTFRQEGRLPFMSALSVGRNASAADPRDHVFAVRSFSMPLEHTTTKGKETVMPDYITSAKHLFVTVGKCLIEAHGPSILSLISDVKNSRVSGLPSWIPDLSTPMHFRPFGIDTSLDTKAPIDGKQTMYNAAGDALRYQPFQVSPNNCLVLNGIKWDIVVDTAEPGLGRVGEGAWGLSRWAILLNSIPGSTSGRRDALWRTLIGDEAAGSHPARDLSKDFSGWLKFISVIELSRYSPEIAKEFKRVNLPADYSRQKYLVVLRAISYSLESLGIPFTAEEQIFFQNLYDGHHDWASWYCNLLGSAEPFGNIVRNKDTSRRLFRTKKNFLGTGPEGTEVGDMVFIIPGTTVPYVMRKTVQKAAVRSVSLGFKKGFGSYQLMGEAYVHGIMHGEGVQGVENKLDTLNII